MNILKFLCKYRFSYLDLFWSLYAFHFALNGFYITFVVVAFAGALVSVILQVIIDKKPPSRDHKWQEAADAGLKVEAIKRHRAIYGSTLKNSHDVVSDYMNQSK